MRKVLVSLVAALVCAVAVSAQSVAFHAGVQGGLTLDKLDLQTTLGDFDIRTAPGWHAGATCVLKLPAHFALQPSVNFDQSRSKGEDGTISRINAINVPIAVEWGPDLGIIRPFVMVAPYVDFLLSGQLQHKQIGDISLNDIKNAANFGVGVGGGVEVWRIQISARYNWGLGSISKTDSLFKSCSRNGVTVTLAYLFL